MGFDSSLIRFQNRRAKRKQKEKTCLEQAANNLTQQNQPQISQILSLSATLGREINASLSPQQYQRCDNAI